MTSEEPRYEIQENLMAWSPTWEEVQEIIEKAMEVDNFKLKADVAKIFKATGEDEEFANTDFFVSYEGPMNMKMYNKENRQAAIFIGYMGFDAVTHNFIHLPLFLLSYGEEDVTPIIMLAMPVV